MKRILLLCLTAVFALAGSELWAQERTVSGRVTSAEDGSPIPGVNVVLKGSSKGTVTDIEGAQHAALLGRVGQVFVIRLFDHAGLEGGEHVDVC